MHTMGREESCSDILPKFSSSISSDEIDPLNRWELFIGYQDGERKNVEMHIELHEKPARIFQQLEEEGKQPRLVLKTIDHHPDVFRISIAPTWV